MRPIHVVQLLVLALIWGSAYLSMRASAPAFGAAAVYLGEPVTLRMVAGCAVVVTGTALTLGLLPRPRRSQAGPRRSTR